MAAELPGCVLGELPDARTRRRREDRIVRSPTPTSRMSSTTNPPTDVRRPPAGPGAASPHRSDPDGAPAASSPAAADGATPSASAATGGVVARVPRDRLGGLAACAAVVVGSLGPWATIGPFTTSGTSGDGAITLVLAALATTAIGLGRLLPGVAVAGGLVAAIGAYDALDIASTGGPLDPSPGWGVLLTTAAGAALAVWAVRTLRGARPQAAASGSR